MANKNKEVKKNNPVKQVAPAKQNNSLLLWVCIAVIALVTYFVFSPSLQNEFTNWDDNFYVTQNPLVKSDTLQVVKIFQTLVEGNYHPVTFLSLALNYQSGKLDPSGYHEENVLFHILNTILVFFFIFLLTRRNLLIAIIVSLFFGIHPMHVESVAWVTERKDVLYVFFFIAGLITYLKYIETKKLNWYIFTFLFFVLSCLSKGMAIVFPGILLLLDYLKDVKWSRRLLLEKIPFVIVALIIGYVDSRTAASQVQTSVSIKNFTIIQRLMFSSYGAMMYMVKLFSPLKLSAFYQYPDTSGSIPLIYYLSPLVVLGIIGAIIYFFIKKEREIVFGLLFYFISIVLVVQLLPISTSIMADRYSYLSYVGLLFVVGYLFNKVWQSKSGVLTALKYPFVLILTLGAITFCSQTYSQTQVWKNSETLWTDVIANYPDASIGYFSRANYYYNVKKTNEALADYTSALKATPVEDDSYVDAYYNRAKLYTKYFKRNDLAIADYTKIIAIDSTFKMAYFERALLYSDLGKNDLAIKDLTKVISINPNYTDAYNDRGALYFAINKFDLAITDYSKAIVLNHTYADYYYNRGLCYDAVNDYEKAVADFTSAIQYSPANAVYYDNRGIANLKVNKDNEAVADFSKSIQINPSVADYWVNRSFAENKLGLKENAQNDALKATQLQGHR